MVALQILRSQNLRTDNWRCSHLKEKIPVYNKWWFLLIAILVAILLMSIPFIISWAYLKGTANGQPNTAFSASDIILFYGSILSFIGTVSLGILALWQNHIFKKTTERQNRLSIRPYLFSTIEDETLLNVYENKMSYYYFSCKDGAFDFENYNKNTPSMLRPYLGFEKAYNSLETLNIPDKEKIEKKKEYLEKQTAALNDLRKKYQVVIYNITNYGNSAATNVNIKMNEKNFMPFFSLAKDHETKLVFIFDFNNVNNGKYIFKIDSTFKDIEDFGAYSQSEKFYISKRSETDLSLSFDEQITSPIKIQEEK